MKRAFGAAEDERAATLEFEMMTLGWGVDDRCVDGQGNVGNE